MIKFRKILILKFHGIGSVSGECVCNVLLLLYCAVLCCIVLYGVVGCCIVFLTCCIVLYCAVLCCDVLCCIVLYCAGCIALYCVVRCRNVLYYVVLCCIVLHCIHKSHIHFLSHWTAIYIGEWMTSSEHLIYLQSYTVYRLRYFTER